MLINLDATTENGVEQVKIDELNNLALTALKDEVLNDPVQRGYKGKSSQEIADLINSPSETMESKTVNCTLQEAIRKELSGVIVNNVPYIIDADGNVVCDVIFKTTIEEIVDTAKTKTTFVLEEKVYKHARISDILSGIPYTNNQLTAEDVESALKL